MTKEQSEANLARWLPHVIPRGDRQVTRTLPKSDAPASSKQELTEAPTVSAGGVGAPLLSKEQSQANLARRIPHVTPSPDRPVTRSLPKSETPVSSQQELTDAPTVSAGGVGAPLLSKEQSQANLARRIPHVTPSPDRPVTRSLPQSGGAATSHPEPAKGVVGEDDMPGAFPETPAGEPQSFVVNPLPATGHDNLQSSVTTSKEDYEKAGGEGTAGGVVSALPLLPATGHKDIDSSVTTSKEDYENAGGEGTAGGSYSVNPIPATGQKDIQGGVTTSKADYDNAVGGEGTTGGVVSALPIPAEGHKDIESSATTSKADYDRVGGVDDQEVSVNPIPATGHDNIQSSVTTSKEGYEKAAAFGTAGVVAGVGAGAALAGALSRPKASDKNIIPESSLPMNPGLLDTRDAGPFMNSAGPGTTTAALASQVPLESKREAQVVDSPEAPEALKAASGSPFISSSGPGTTTSNLASQVPLEPKHQPRVVDDEPPTSQISSSSPLVSSVGSGATTAGLASQVPLESKRDAQVVGSSGPEAPASLKEAGAVPFISSSGPGTTTANLASQVPLEPKYPARVVDHEPPTSSISAASPLIASVGAGATTAALASQVPLEQKRQGQVFDSNDLAGAVPGTATTATQGTGRDAAPAGIVAEKAALDKELLQKVPESEARGAPASAAKAQTSYYGLATAVPETVEDSMTKAHASPEAATETSAVAEKSAMERELQERVPVVDSAGEPAPTISAATATTAPDATSASAATTAAAITDGKTANQTVPGTDTSTTARGPSAGEIAGGAVAGGAAAAGVAALAARHKDRDVEPPRVADSQKPNITTEALPNTQVPGSSRNAAAQVSDGTGAQTPGTEHPPHIPAPPVERSDADATDYAPVRAAGLRPGVSASAGAALSDGCEDPTQVGEPTRSPPAGIGAASSHPGVSPVAAAALSDGTEDPTSAEQPKSTKTTAPVERSEATATEYAPPQARGVAPGVSPAAAAALSDGTEDPTLSEEPTSRAVAASGTGAQSRTVDPTDRAIARPQETVYDKVTGSVPGISPAAGIITGDSTTKGITSDTTSKAITSDTTTKGKGIGPIDPTDQAVAKPAGTVHDKVTGTTTPTKKKPDAAAAAAAAAVIKSSNASPKSGVAEGQPRGSESVTRSKSFMQRLGGPSTPKKGSTAGGVAAGSPASASTTPKSTTASEGERKTKKRNRLSQIIHKIFD